MMSSSIPDDSVKELCENVRSMTYHLVEDLLSIWEEMFEVTQEEKKKRFKKLSVYIKGFFNDILQSEEDKRQEILQIIDSKMKEFCDLQQDLSVIGEIQRLEIRKPYSEFLKDLDKSMASYMEEKNKRIEKAKELRSEEQVLCEELGISSLPPFSNPIPTEQQIDALQLKIFELHEEKINRLKTYKITRGNIINLSKQLDRQPMSKFEKDLHLAEEENFRPSRENMELLEELRKAIQKEYDETIMRRQNLLVRLAKLWSLLKLTSDERESFLTRYNTVSKTHMNAIESEIDRCETLRLKNIRQIIEATREQIGMLWDKVTYTEVQRLQFEPFYTDLYTEDVLLLHEAEIDRLEKFYLDNKHIFELAEKRNSLWERLLQLDQLAQDKTRLFSNRGGQLLKDEKERKELESSLPRIDKQLKAALTEYGTSFFWYGKDLLEKITQDWEERIESKASQKSAKKVVSSMGTETNNRLGVNSASRQKRVALTPLNGDYGKMRRCESATTPKVDKNHDDICRSVGNLVAGGSSISSSLVGRDREISPKNSLERAGEHTRSCPFLPFACNPSTAYSCFK